MKNKRENKGLRLANKFIKRHINYKSEIMNVRLVAQTLSEIYLFNLFILF